MIIYILYIILSPLIWALLLISIIFNEKIRLRFFSYKKLFYKAINTANVSNKRIILFHAASNGELEQLKPLFRKIDRNKYFILLTISSPSCINSIHQNEIDCFCYQAFDFPWSVYKFFKKIKPEKYIITRHDIWPNHITIAKIFSIQSYLINANLPSSSKRIWPIFKRLSQFLFKKFTQIYTVSDMMGNRIKQLTLNLNNVKIIGDTRFDQIQYRKIKSSNNIPIMKNMGESKNILFGSIEENDLNIIFDSIDTMQENLKKNNIKLIFVPHEPDQNILINLESKLKELDIETMRYTTMINKNINVSLKNYGALIVDYTGILADLYKYSAISYIGCGFGKGVHNVAEPAIYGNTICFGPKFDILNEAIEMVKNKIAYCVNNEKELSEVINIIFNEKKLNKNSKKITEYIKSKSNLTQKIIDEIF